MENSNSLDFLFHPRTVAVAGVKEDLNKFNAGFMFLEGLMKMGFKGNIYALNPNGGEISGIKIYKSLKDISDKVDFIISAIPARHTPRLVADAAEKGVRAIHFFTSGFSEIENAEGKKLQAEVLAKAKAGGIRIIGPNCLGLYCPASGLTFCGDFAKISGQISMLSQSGGNASHGVEEGNSRGIFFNKVISMGNGADLNESDFMEYLAQDVETKIITAYIEGVREGERFYRALKDAAEKKPTIILKVGTTESGAEAARSHTTAMAGSNLVWEGILKQTGAIRAGSVEEMMDLSLAFQHMQMPRGNKIVIIGIGGGASVILADEFADKGLVLPKLSDGLRKKMIELFPNEAGRIFKNPVDVNNIEDPALFLKVMKTLDQSEEVDMLAIQVAFDHLGLMPQKEKAVMLSFYLNIVGKISREVKKPLSIIFHSYPSEAMKKISYEATKKLNAAGIAVFPSMQRAAVALKKFLTYYEKRRATKLSV